MKSLYIDSVGGLAGDMFLGAALDAGFVTLGELQDTVSKWLPEPVTLASREVQRNGMRARTFRVEVSNHHTGHEHRDVSDIGRLLDKCPIPAGAIGRAKAMFHALAEAEAKVHGIPVHNVHFHEVGATDSLVDFALAAWVLDRLDARVEAGPAVLGRGRIGMGHGVWPVPPPATLELLLRGHIPTRALPERFPWENAELTTPTGACLLLLAARFGDPPPGVVKALGVGAGTMDIPGYPNVTRLLLIETNEKPQAPTTQFDRDTVAVLETWLDDFPGNLLALVADELREAGAHEVAISPATFKKGRSGHRVEVLGPSDRAEALAEILLGRTTALGLRVSRHERWKLFREAAMLDGLAAKHSRDASGRIERTVPETDALEERAKAGGLAPMFGWRIEPGEKKA